MTRAHHGIETIHTLPMSNINQLDGANHNYLRGTIHHTGKQEQRNKINCMFTAVLLSTHKPSLKQNNVTQLFPWGGSTQSLAPAHTQWLSSLIPVRGWHRQEGQQGQEQGRESALTSLTVSISLPCDSQSLHRDLNTAFNHSKVTSLNLALAWRANILTVCSLSYSKHRPHHSPIFRTHFGTGQLLWTFELFCMLQHVRNFFLVLEQT